MWVLAMGQQKPRTTHSHLTSRCSSRSMMLLAHIWMGEEVENGEYQRPCGFSFSSFHSAWDHSPWVGANYVEGMSFFFN